MKPVMLWLIGSALMLLLALCSDNKPASQGACVIAALLLANVAMIVRICR